MNPTKSLRRRAAFSPVLAAIILLSTFAGPGIPTQAQAQQNSFADPAFKRIWDRTDLPIAQGRVSRTWVWGPTPGKSMQEPYREGRNGTHLVQYFDKARMEINNPNGNSNDPFYVTNGLLVVAMISGRVQVGNDLFESRGPSSLRIAGDEGSDAPSYAALQGLASDASRDAPIPVGQLRYTHYVNRSGETRPIPSQFMDVVNRNPIKGALYVQETGHNIPEVFWSYLNSRGPVYEGNTLVAGNLFNWLSAFGFPVTEPYWTSIRVAGVDKVVLFQAFQRRVLTYSPDNPQGWKVEMGNVGQQYYSWRYETPTLNCRKVPLRGFGKVWAEHPNVQVGLGCPAEFGPVSGGGEVTVETAHQPFQHGEMLWVKPPTALYPNLIGPTIYVFFNDGTFQRFDDTWREGQPVNGGLTPPAGLYEPVRGFGKVWREGTGARVRERLGWATAPERGGPGAYQQFQFGEMFWSSTVRKIWVLYGTLGSNRYPPYPSTEPLRYDVYNDTYTP